jgi:hypothetical protein
MGARLSRKYVSGQNNKRRYAWVKKHYQNKGTNRNVWIKQYKNLSVLFEMSSVNVDKSVKVDTEMKVVMDGVVEMDQAQQDAANGEYSRALSCPVLLMCCHSLSHLYTNVVIYVCSPLLNRNDSIPVLLYIAVFNICMLVLGPYLMHGNKLPSISVYGEWNTTPENKREGTNRSVTPTYVVIYPWYVVVYPWYTYSILVINRI